MTKIRWGILSTAKIGREKVIPAMQASQYCDIRAIASRDTAQGKAVAAKLNIPVVYGSYEELLADDAIDAVYIPLPNHLHVTWALKAVQAGKHVLCEKPIALSSAEADQLLQAARERPHLKVMEAFMYRFHPQWVQAKKWVQEGQVGRLHTIQSFFSYFNSDPNNIRNQKELGGGGLMDIGCYSISLSRFIFDEEPVSVMGQVEYDKEMQIDTLASAVMNFSTGNSSFTCSTQLMPYQRVNILGTEGRVEIEIPFNAPPNESTRIWLYTKKGREEKVFQPVDQYSLQGDLFSQSIINNTPVPTPLEDAVNNMKVIEAVFESAKTGRWQNL